MAQRQTREQLGVQVGDSIIVKGKVAFARLDKLVEGSALDKENERRAKHGMISTKPFRSITIEDPEVVQGQNTPLANFYGQSVYQSKSTGKNTMSLESKSLFPPQYGHIQNGKIVEIEDPKRNPAPGQVVYLMISAFKAKGFNNLGSSFNAIVFEEGDIQFYEGNNSLAGFGQAMNMPVETMPQAQPQPVQNEPEPNQDQNTGGFGGNTGNTGFGQTPNEQPAQQPNQGGFGQPNTGQGFGQNPNTGQGFGQNPNQAQQDSPFGIQDKDVSNHPFGGNAGQPTQSPFA